MAEPHDQTSLSQWPVAAALGWVSMGLGLAGLLTPRRVGALTGLEGREGLIRLVGARELASGAGLLTQRSKAPWLWARVAGDVMDLALLVAGHSPTRSGRSRAMGAGAVVAAITAADIAASVLESRFPRPTREAPDIYIDRTIIVNKTPQECYDYWRDLRNVASFTQRLEKVTPLDERRSRWSMKVPGGGHLEWTSELIEDKPGERLRWRSVEGAPFNHAGAVSFSPAPGGRGTFVTVGLHYHAPGGAVGAALARVVGPDPFGEVRENLRRFKQLIETGEISTTTGQPSGRRSLLGRILPEGRRSKQDGAERRPPPHYRPSASEEERIS
jgi:uncharacterized membrane protein